jgi:DNA-binding transcriptional LysR family regulator
MSVSAIRHLPYFVVVAQEQSMARAAVRLGLSGSALTRRMQDLEHELGGVQLFERRRTGVTLTSAGRAYLKDVTASLDYLDQAGKRAGCATRGEIGTLRIGFNAIASRQDFLHDAFRRFNGRYPDIKLELVPMVSDLQIARLRAGGLDAAFLSFPFADQGFGFRDLGDYPMLLTLPGEHPLSQSDDLSLVDLRNENFVGITRASSPSTYDLIMAEFHRAGYSPNMVCETHCDATICNLVATGIGVGFLTKSFPRGLPAGMRQIHLPDFSVSMALSFVWRNSGDPLIRRFVELVEDVTESLVERRDAQVA